MIRFRPASAYGVSYGVRTGDELDQLARACGHVGRPRFRGRAAYGLPLAQSHRHHERRIAMPCKKENRERECLPGCPCGVTTISDLALDPPSCLDKSSESNGGRRRNTSGTDCLRYRIR